jgi:hypothetical protein
MRIAYPSALFLAALSALLWAGCTSPSLDLKFKTVDAVSGEPLQGVRVEWAQIRYYYFLNWEVKTVKLSPTDQLGLVLALGAKEGHSFSFAREGYSPAAALVDSGNSIGIVSRFDNISKQGK